MFTSVTIQDANGTDVAFHDGDRRLGACQGLHGLPAPRRLVRERPGRHGEIHTTSHYASRQPVWSGVLTGDTATALWGEYDTLLEALWGAVDTPRLMKWTRADGTLLQSYVRVGESFDPVIQATDAGMILRYQLVLDREDPRNYSQSLTTVAGDALTDAAGGATFPATFPVRFTASGSGTASVTNTGTIPTPAVFKVHGEITAPHVLHVQTGRRIVFTGTVSTGDHLEVDTALRSVLLNGTTDRTNLVDYTQTDWDTGEVPPGTSTYRLVGGTFTGAARLDVLFRSAHA